MEHERLNQSDQEQASPRPIARVVRSGRDGLEAMLELFASAEREIVVQCYIASNDRTGKRVSAALALAAGRGVSVTLLLDAFGCYDLDSNFSRYLKARGVVVQWFNPLLKLRNLYVGRRMHHKVVVVDRRVAFVAGMNLSDDYYYESGDSGVPWLDFGVIIHGLACQRLAAFCDLLLEQHSFWRRALEWRRSPGARIQNVPGAPIVAINDWIYGFREITREYRRAISKARHEITVINAYFFPSRKELSALAGAVERGVRVNLVLAGNSDLPWVRWGTQYLCRRLIKRGIAVYEWSQSVLHAKVAVVDDRWVTVGSYNFDFISSYMNIETNVILKGEAIPGAEIAALTKVISECHLVPGSQDIDLRLVRNFFAFLLLRFLRTVAYFLLPKFHFLKKSYNVK